MPSVTETLKKGRKRRTRHGKSRRLRSKSQLAHKPSGVGKGRWHSRTSLWKSKRADRRKRKIAAESRRINRS